MRGSKQWSPITRRVGRRRRAGEELLQTGSTATEPGGRDEWDVSDLTDHSFNSRENTVMARRQTVTDTGGSRGRRRRKTEEEEEEGRRGGEGGKKTGSSTRPPAVRSSWGVTRQISA